MIIQYIHRNVECHGIVDSGSEHRAQLVKHSPSVRFNPQSMVVADARTQGINVVLDYTPGSVTFLFAASQKSAEEFTGVTIQCINVIPAFLDDYSGYIQ